MRILSTFSLAWSTLQGRSRMIPNEEKPEVSSARSHPQDAPRLPLLQRNLFGMNFTLPKRKDFACQVETHGARRGSFGHLPTLSWERHFWSLGRDIL